MDASEKAKWARIKRVYGLTKEQYDDLLGDVCPICLRGWSASVRPCIDHDHRNGEVRGIICLWCNLRVVGRHRDGNLFSRAADYLLAERRGWIVPKKKKRRKKNASRPKRRS